MGSGSGLTLEQVQSMEDLAMKTPVHLVSKTVSEGDASVLVGLVRDLAADWRRQRGRIEQLEADYEGGDQESQARAWSAVYKALHEVGLLSFIPTPLGVCGRERAIQFIRHLDARIKELEHQQGVVA